jgi:hypothetical protein
LNVGGHGRTCENLLKKNRTAEVRGSIPLGSTTLLSAYSDLEGFFGLDLTPSQAVLNVSPSAAYRATM